MKDNKSLHQKVLSPPQLWAYVLDLARIEKDETSLVYTPESEVVHSLPIALTTNSRVVSLGFGHFLLKQEEFWHIHTHPAPAEEYWPKAFANLVQELEQASGLAADPNLAQTLENYSVLVSTQKRDPTGLDNLVRYVAASLPSYEDICFYTKLETRRKGPAKYFSVSSQGITEKKFDKLRLTDVLGKNCLLQQLILFWHLVALTDWKPGCFGNPDDAKKYCEKQMVELSKWTNGVISAQVTWR